MPVPDKLAGLLPRVGESHPVHNVVESGLQNLEEIVSSYSPATLGLHKVLMELALHDAVKPADLLFLAKLEPEL